MRVFAVLLLSVVLIFKLNEGGVNGQNVDNRRNPTAAEDEIDCEVLPLDEDPVYDENTIYVEKPNGKLVEGTLYCPLITPGTLTLEQLSNKVRFHLWTRQTPSSVSSERLWVDNPRVLRDSTFNRAHPTKFLIHGFTNNIRSPMIQKPKEAYLDRGEYNVIGVDWGDLCKQPLYCIAKMNTFYVGKYVGEMIKLLYSQGRVSLQSIHIIGHSLGAHVAGIAGSSLGRNKIGRITGLDPAGPKFRLSDPVERRLDASDANYVDVIHTCTGSFTGCLGFKYPLGKADFYPNGGANPQPGSKKGIAICTAAYSHSYAHVLWTQTINDGDSDRYNAFKCRTIQDALANRCTSTSNENEIDGQIGEFSDPSMRGLYGLSTRA